ncbi:MAG: transglutaminase-like domain-containing protein [Phycisphaerae bacterium]
MQNHKHSIALMLAGLLTFCVAVPAAKTGTINPPQGIFFDQYYALYLGKTKCGWAWYQLERKKDLITSTNKLNIKIGRDNLTLEINTTSETSETLDGRPLTFLSQMDLAGSKTVYRGEFKNSVVTMQITQAGQPVSHKFTAPADTTMAWGNYLQNLKYLNQPGTSYTCHLFDPQIGPGKVGLTTVTIVGPASIEIAGKKITGIKTIARSEDLGPFPISSYFDRQGYMIATDMQMGIMKLQIVTATKKEALANIKPEEIFTRSFVKLDKPLNLAEGKYLKLKISSIGPNSLPNLPETSMQKVLLRKPRSAEIQICSPGMKRLALNSPKPSAVYLASSTYTKINDPLLIKLANQAAGKAKDPKEIAKRLCLFVSNYFTDKNLSRAFDSASESARTKTGDCSEHAVLMAALARIKKIPSQVVSGLVYTDRNGSGAFGYHMWTQVWIDNQWLDMDPTFGEVQPDPTHIALALEDLADETFIKQAVELVKFIGQVKIEQMEK